MPSNSASPDRPRVLIAHRYLWPDNLSLFPAMLKDIAEWHAAQGHRLTILTASGEDPSTRRAWAAQHGIELIELPLGCDRGHGAVYRAATLLRFLLGLLRVLATRRFDLVMTTSNPQVAAAVVVRWMSRLRRFEYLYYLQDHFPEAMLAKPWRVLRAIGWITQRMDRRNVDRAKWVLTLHEGMRQTLLRRGCHGGNIQIIQNFAVDDAQPATARAAAEVPTLVFAGNQGAIQNLPHFLLASGQAAAAAPHHVRMLGWGSETERLKWLAAERGMTHVTFEGVVPRDEAQRRIAACDVGVVAAAPGLFDVAYPSKTASYLAAGLPVLVFVDPQSAVAQDLEQHGFGLSASPTDLSHATSAIERLVCLSRQGVYDAPSIQRQAVRLFSRERYFETYAGLFDRAAQVRAAA